MHAKRWFWPLAAAMSAMFGTAVLCLLNVPRAHTDGLRVPFVLTMTFAGLAAIEAWWFYHSPSWFIETGIPSSASACLAVLFVLLVLWISGAVMLGGLALLLLPLFLMFDLIGRRLTGRYVVPFLRRIIPGP